MRAAAVQWDLSGMGVSELLSEPTLFFLAKVKQYKKQIKSRLHIISHDLMTHDAISF